MTGKRDRIPFGGYIDDHSAQRSLRSAIYFSYRSGSWRCVDNPRRFLVAEKNLALGDDVTFFDLHGRLHARIVWPQYRRAARRVTLLNSLAWCAAYWQVQPFLNIDHEYPSVPQALP